MRRLPALMLALLALVALSAPALAEKRVALVIGNNAYPNLAADKQLKNAIADARAMRETLAGLGFEVLYGEDLDRRSMVERLFDLAARLGKDDVAFFFFAGHGVSFSGANYLLPSDIPAARATGLAEEGRIAALALAETEVLQRMTASGARVAVAVLDACRNNPLQTADVRTFGETRGLVRAVPPRGVLSIYSAGLGQLALDRLPGDRHPNSVFTRVFIEKLKTPGLELKRVASQTRDEVVTLAQRIGHEQIPAYYDQVIGDVFLAGLPTVKPETSRLPDKVDPCASAADHWRSAETMGSLVAFEDHLTRFPDCAFAGLARARIAELKKPVAAVVPPAPPATPPARVEPAVAAPPVPPATPAVPVVAPYDAYERAERAGTKEAWEAFLSRYPMGFYADRGRARLEELQKSKAAVVAPPVQPAPATPALPVAPSVAPYDAYERAERAGTEEAWEAFLSRYPTGFYADRGRARLEELQRSKAAVVTPPVAPSVPSKPVQPAVGVYPTPPGVYPLSPERARALKPKETFKECDTCPEMVVMPAGSFTMGSPASETERSADEGPQRRVTFSRPFAVGKFAVTFDEWDACVADGGCGYRPSDSGWGRGKRPVINVSWDDAKAYVAWLSRRTGKTYRLLSEAEREYVTRAGTTTPFWWGSTISTSRANYDGNHTYGKGSKGEYRQKTVPVDSFRPSPWGLYQLHGNVGEWVEDCWEGTYGGAYYGAPRDGSAWTAGDCTRRVLRGGSWRDNPRNLRSAARDGEATNKRHDFVGFRVARTLAP